MKSKTALNVRSLKVTDLEEVIALDALLTGSSKPGYFQDIYSRFVKEKNCIGLGVEAEGNLLGYLLGEVRAFEFGSDACGWIFALGVRPDSARQGAASALVAEARRRFRRLGVRSLRTMVQRTDVPFLSLFRQQGFVGGPFVQLELDITEEDQP